MLKCRFKQKNGRTMLVLGLSHHNIALLERQRTITINGSELGLDIDVFVFAGETEESMATDLKDQGLLPPDFDTSRLQPGDRREFKGAAFQDHQAEDGK